jgi:hypothetical protein
MKWARETGLWDQYPKPQPPTSYPCFGYTVLQSFGYEELAPEYLYMQNLVDMKDDLLQAIIDAKPHCEHCKKPQPKLSHFAQCAEALRAINYGRAGT